MSNRIPIAIAAAGVIVAIAVYMAIPKADTSSGTHPSLVRPIQSSDHILGNPAAKVTIVEYSDFDCDFCKSFHETLHQVVATEGTTGELAWVFRQFPITEQHPNAFSHALASECAAAVGGNDAFWKFADALFDHQPVNPSDYGVLAQQSGISSTAFASCYASASSTLSARITADRQNALNMGTDGTPYSLLLVRGKTPVVIDGPYPYEAVKGLVDEALDR